MMKILKCWNDSTKCLICGDVYADGDVKIRDHCHITGKYRRFAYRFCNIIVKSNNKIPIVSHTLNNYDSHLIM